MLSMIRLLASTSDRRGISFLHVARDGAHHPFKEELRVLLAAVPNSLLHVSYSRPREEDVIGRGFDAVGRLDVAKVVELLPDLDADFYLCGPVPFMSQLTEGLLQSGVDGERIHSESFGPATIR